MYSEKVMDHFQNPRNVGEIENASGVGTVGNAKCGDIMRIYLDVDENQVIRDVKFKTFGCGAAVATSSMATEMVKGKTIEEAMKVTNKAVMEALDGLPPVKVHCSLLAEEAIHAALWDYAEKHHIRIEGLEKPKSDISEHEEEEDARCCMDEVEGQCARIARDDRRRSERHAHDEKRSQVDHAPIQHKRRNASIYAKRAARRLEGPLVKEQARNEAHDAEAEHLPWRIRALPEEEVGHESGNGAHEKT